MEKRIFFNITSEQFFRRVSKDPSVFLRTNQSKFGKNRLQTFPIKCAQYFSFAIFGALEPAAK